MLLAYFGSSVVSWPLCSYFLHIISHCTTNNKSYQVSRGTWCTPGRPPRPYTVLYGTPGGLYRFTFSLWLFFTVWLLSVCLVDGLCYPVSHTDATVVVTNNFNYSLFWHSFLNWIWWRNSLFFIIFKFFTQLIKLTLRIQLLQNISCIPRVVQYTIVAYCTPNSLYLPLLHLYIASPHPCTGNH